MISVIILAIIQSLTEFVPVSSSGHLLAAQETTSLEGSLVIDVALHVGTLLALVVYFWSKITSVVTDFRASQTLILNLVITSIPAAVAGYFFADFFEDDVRSLGVVIIMLVLIGLFMIVADRVLKTSNNRTPETLTRTDAIVIGIGQTLALIPGTSRSGVTMLAGRVRGLSNKVAAEYAFLAGIPVIAGAALKVGLDAQNASVIEDQLSEILVGIAVAFVVGYLVIRILLPFLAKHGLKVFGYYRLALAALLFIIWLYQ